MKVLVVGSGGRCHAIVKALSKSKQVTRIYAAPGNAGMSELATLIPISATNVSELLAFAKIENMDLTVVGPEVSLAAGIVNEFEKNNLKIFGPTKEAATIESSKSFAKDLMKKYNIPTAAFEIFSDFEKALAYASNMSLPVVIKYDGLAAGKGVVICHSMVEVEDNLREMLIDDKFGEPKVVIEEYLDGPEFSFMCFVSNENVYPLVISQDHKRAFEGDKGPNTGGMGAYSGVPIIDQADVDYAQRGLRHHLAHIKPHDCTHIQRYRLPLRKRAQQDARCAHRYSNIKLGRHNHRSMDEQGEHHRHRRPQRCV